MATKRAGVRTRRVVARVLACAAVVPIGLGPSMIAFAQVGTETDATTSSTTTTSSSTSAPPITQAPTTTAPTTTAPATTAPATTAPTTGDSPSTGTTAAPTTTAPTTGDDPSTGTTAAPLPTSVTTEPGATASTTTTDPAAVTDPTAETTTSLDPGSTTAVPDSTTTSPAPPAPVVLAANPTETIWTLGLRYIGGTTYTGPFQLYLRSRFGGSTVGLRDGEVSGPLSRGVGVDYYVRVEMGSSYDPAFPFSWECTGSDSGVQTATTEQFTPAVSDLDATMDCVFIIDNTNPPTIDVVTIVEGDAAGDVSFDYAVAYNFFGDWPIDSYTGTDGTTRSFDGMAEIPHRDHGDRRPGRPRPPSRPRSCVGMRAADSSPRRPRPVSFSPSRGAAITCTATHTVPATLTIVEDVVPDDPAAPAAAYSRSFGSVSGPSTWTLVDGASETFVFPSSLFGSARFTRFEVPGWDLTAVECLEDLGGGATAAYTDFTTSFGTTQGSASFPLPPPGTDLICRFIAEPAGPPSLDLDVNVNVVDLSAYGDVDVEVRTAAGTLIDTLTIAPGAGTQNLLLDSGDTAFSLTLLDDQGLSVEWVCGADTSTADTIGFSTILGETTGCRLNLSEPFPAGTGSILLTKDEDPDSGDYYEVTVRLGDFVLGTTLIFEGGPGLLISDVADGVYTVTEIGRFTDFELSAVDCIDATPSSVTRTVIPPPSQDTSVIRRGEFTLDTRDPGAADVACVLTNTPSTDPAIIRVETVATGAAATFDYAFDPAGSVTTGSPTFAQADGAIAARGVSSGEFFTISQAPDPAYATTVDCFYTDGGIANPEPGLEGYVFAEPGADYTCRFVNTAIAVPTATLELVTEVEPDTGITFSYDLTPATEVVAPSPTTVDQTDGDTATLTTTAGSAITITHAAPFGYETTTACVDGPTTISTGTSTITYTPADGSTVRCTFTHRRLPSLTIIESVIPDGLGLPAATFTAGPAGAVVFGPTVFALADDQQETLLLQPGTNSSVSRDGPAGLSATGPVSCVLTLPAGGVVGYVPMISAEDFVMVTPDYGDAITCSFPSTQSPAPELRVRNIADVLDPTAFDDFEVLVTGPTGEVARLAVPLNDVALPLDLEAATGYTLTVVDDQGLAIDWIGCGGTTGGPGSSISFTTTTPGTLYACAFRSTETLPSGTGSLTIGIDHDPDVPTAITELYVGVGPFEVTMSASSITGDGSITAGALPDATYDGTARYRYDEIVTGIVGDASCRLGGTTVEYSAGGLDRITSFSADIVGGSATSCTLQLGPIVHEVTVDSEIDLGGLDVPPDLPGFFVDFDGDLAYFDEPAIVGAAGGPGGHGLNLRAFVPGSSAFTDSRFVDPNGSVSILVDDGGSLDIAAGAGSGRFANTITCPGGTTAPDGSVSLSGIAGPVTCSMTSAAGRLRVINRVTGPTTATDWPFTITDVLAGPTSAPIAAGGAVTVAVAAGVDVTITQTDARGATTVTSSCRSGLISPFVAGADRFTPANRVAAMLFSTRVVNVAGGDAQTCTFVNGYPTIIPPTTTTTTTTTRVPPTTATTVPPTTTATTTVPTTRVPAAVPPRPTLPFIPTATPTTVPGVLDRTSGDHAAADHGPRRSDRHPDDRRRRRRRRRATSRRATSRRRSSPRSTRPTRSSSTSATRSRSMSTAPESSSSPSTGCRRSEWIRSSRHRSVWATTSSAWCVTASRSPRCAPSSSSRRSPPRPAAT